MKGAIALRLFRAMAIDAVGANELADTLVELHPLRLSHLDPRAETDAYEHEGVYGKLGHNGFSLVALIR